MQEVTLLTITPDCEKLIEQAGRTCYLSFDKINDASAQKFIRMIVKSGHHSVIEHASASFRIRGSRAMTHQLVRHRLFSYSQQSQRYVKEMDFDYITPPSIEGNAEANELYQQTIKMLQENYAKLLTMSIKKEDARFVLPNAAMTEIVVSGNFREWRHFIEARGDSHAQWEIREIAISALKELQKHAPTVFEDYIIDEKNRTVTKTSSSEGIH